MTARELTSAVNRNSSACQPRLLDRISGIEALRLMDEALALDVGCFLVVTEGHQHLVFPPPRLALMATS